MDGKPVWNMYSVLQKKINCEKSHLVGCTLRRNISFKPRPLYPRANSSKNPLNLGEHHSGFRNFRHDKNFSPLPKIEPQCLGSPALSLVKVIQDAWFSTTLRQVVKFTFGLFYFRRGPSVDMGQKTTWFWELWEEKIVSRKGTDFGHLSIALLNNPGSYW